MLWNAEMILWLEMTKLWWVWTYNQRYKSTTKAVLATLSRCRYLRRGRLLAEPGWGVSRTDTRRYLGWNIWKHTTSVFNLVPCPVTVPCRAAKGSVTYSAVVMMKTKQDNVKQFIPWCGLGLESRILPLYPLFLKVGTATGCS